MWCKMNKLDINFKKTYIMIITRHRVEIPKLIMVNGIDIEVVQTFKLLGVTIDSKLIFASYKKMTLVCFFSLFLLVFYDLINQMEFFSLKMQNRTLMQLKSH